MSLRRPARAGGSATMAASAGPLLHPDPIHLAMGEPAEGLPPVLEEAARRALAEGATRYGPPAGHADLREALAASQTGRDGLARAAENVIVTAGAKPALIDAMRVLLEPGDEVLVLSPHWPTYCDQARAAGAVPVTVPPGPGQLPDAAAVEAAVGPRTRALIVNSPNNPTGRVLSRETLSSLADVARRRALWVLADQAYVDLTYGEPAPTWLTVAPDLAEQSVVVETFSKRFSMTGLRLGAAIAPADVVAALTDLASTATTHPNSVAQRVGLAALSEADGWLEEQRARYRRRHLLALEALNALPGVTVGPADAALFLLPNVEGALANLGLDSDAEFAKLLAERAGVLVVPGSAMGAPGHLRVSLGATDARLEEAFARCADALAG